MSWESEVEDLERRRLLALRQGGKEAIARQHARGRLTIRERIVALLDLDTFEEHGRATAIPDTPTRRNQRLRSGQLRSWLRQSVRASHRRRR